MADSDKPWTYLMQGNCLERMKEIPDGYVDLVMCDLPYGTTACKWDSVIELKPLWDQYLRVVKAESAIVLTCSQPFTTTLISSKLELFKYCWVWRKSKGSGFLNSKNAPIKMHEDIAVFSKGTTANKSDKRMNYNPQGLVKVDRVRKQPIQPDSVGNRPSRMAETYPQEFAGYPSTVLDFPNDGTKLHPTQKPVALLEYMIKTYSKEGQTVLDNTMGSGSTGVACVNTGRNFIGIEMDDAYFAVASKRIKDAKVPPND